MIGRDRSDVPVDVRLQDRRRGLWATLAVLAGLGLIALTATAVAHTGGNPTSVAVAGAGKVTTTIASGATNPGVSVPAASVTGQVLPAPTSATTAATTAKTGVAAGTATVGHGSSPSMPAGTVRPTPTTTAPAPATGANEITTPGLWLLARDGSGLRRLVSGQPDTAAWSPDDSQVALGENGGIDILTVANGAITHLAGFATPNRITSLAWSPDGTLIAANVMLNPSSTATVGGISYDLVIVNVSSGTTTSLGAIAGGDSPTWSAQGCLGWAGGSVDIWCPGRPLLTLPPLPGSDGFSWSPDGTHFAITSSADATPGALLTYAADGSGEVDLGNTGVTPFTWAGGGDGIVFESINPVSNNLFVQPVSGGPARVLGVPNGPFAVNGVDDGVIFKVGLSPGSSSLVAITTSDPTQHRLVTIGPGTGGVTSLFWARDGKWLLAEASPTP